ncbi:uncharacterized protein VTP21DRAFT_805 [Calcarisporiella thermophila]|uniref:uncharacterized protein n=1 Tax=Calcarisporiella thermophila TaxID=911321 RepID=UPI00374321DC
MAMGGEETSRNPREQRDTTRASPEIINNRAKLDIEEVIGAELMRARKNRQIEQFRRRWCKLGAVREGAIGAALILG